MPQIFAVNKPKGISSFAAIRKIKRIFGVKKVGHAGTLDPLASGVLVVAVGREATKQLGQIVGKEKEYLAQIKLGQTSLTDDEEGEKTFLAKPEDFNFGLEEIKTAVKEFVGKIKQTPPQFSALKIKGQRAYKLARSGQEVAMKPRPAIIKEIEVLSYQPPLLSLRVVTGPGVYIRALARDLGQRLGVGGYLSDLKRIRVGEFTLEQARNLDEILK